MYGREGGRQATRGNRRMGAWLLKDVLEIMTACIRQDLQQSDGLFCLYSTVGSSTDVAYAGGCLHGTKHLDI